MPVFKIQHITKYEYERLVQESVNEIKIYPSQVAEQEVLQQDIFITGNPEVLSFLDYWGNKTGVFNVTAPHKEMVINSRLVVRTTVGDDIRVNYLGHFDELPAAIEGQMKMIELSMADRIASQGEIREIAAKVKSKEGSVAETIQNCSNYIFENFKYIKGITSIETTVDEILVQRGGVCQDFAHMMLQILRTLKIPSRYVSGYICPNKNGLRGEGATHAWVEAWIPGQGWAGTDPTNNIWVTNTHIKLAVGRDFRDCSPVKGTFKGPAVQHLSVYVSVDYEDGQIFEDMNTVDQHQEEEEMVLLSHQVGTQQQ